MPPASTQAGRKALIASPMTLEFHVVRTSLLLGLLKTLRENRWHALPLRIFEATDVVFKDISRARQARNVRHAGANLMLQVFYTAPSIKDSSNSSASITASPPHACGSGSCAEPCSVSRLTTRRCVGGNGPAGACSAVGVMLTIGVAGSESSSDSSASRGASFCPPLHHHPLGRWDT
ncbi:hypothetical protein FA95DRAFT_1578811 [Auriscalpium vulgare]|uniref:Uncharacterized protein n=1 Tax=Auriscalpium vulgare TaxID=40419 RepID=A0ACB8R069_9AGAM|nr:hypothetical protein FA95DRAFT_1578811 [Auriscalpium vulgare]